MSARGLFGGGLGGVATIALVTSACSNPPGQVPTEGAGSSAGSFASGGAGGTEGAGGAGATSSGGSTSGGGVGAAGGSPVASGSSAAGGAGGLPSGGSASGGAGAEPASGGSAGGSESGGAAGSGGGPGSPPKALTKLGEKLVTGDGLTIISYGGYLNGESFQQEGVVTHGTIQYAAFWNQARHVVLAGRVLPEGDWYHLELADYTNALDDAHNTISIGLSPADGTLHLAFDHHDSELHYRRSVAAFLDEPPGEWAVSDFGPVTATLAEGGEISRVTYPRFITAPDGQSLLLNLRIGASGNGTARLWEYTSEDATWTLLGDHTDGAPVDENPYFHGIAFVPGGGRLHLAWCNRATPDATTNHDLYHVYSDDRGRTFFNEAGDLVAEAGTNPLTSNSSRALVAAIGQNRGLINQEHMVVDPEGRVHVLLSHLPDGEADDSDFARARTKSEFFHYVREPTGGGKRTALGASVIENFRGSLGVAPSGNLYAILPDLRIYGASRESDFQDWALLYEDAGRFFSDPLVDRARLEEEGVLSVVYPAKGSSDIFVLDFAVD